MSQLEPKRINEAMEARLESKKKVPKKPHPNASGSLSPENMQRFWESSKITFCAVLNFSRKLFTSSMQTSVFLLTVHTSRLPCCYRIMRSSKLASWLSNVQKGISTVNKLTLSRVESAPPTLTCSDGSKLLLQSLQEWGENIFASTISIKRSLTDMGSYETNEILQTGGATRPTNSYMNIREVLLYGGGVGAFVIALDNVRGVVGAFVIALDDVQEKKFQSTSDHVESANDFAMNCEETFASRNVQDDGISKGDNLVMYFSLPAGVVINVLNGETTMYTTF
ncbi:hypothetical protein H5410_056241 [Solanum commersonii]|uniref:Uncharacterized protein n=1 Tax=Solanum commersonii TaxID=4109 RepID=A0A9J5WJQ5_SOLCO|nr:hypothetical protein H5410_056241 [Solanum commersonii]